MSPNVAHAARRGRAARVTIAGAAALFVLGTSGVVTAEESGIRLAVAPAADADTTFVIHRSESVSRGPVGGKRKPEKSAISSLVRVRAKASPKQGEITLAITYLRVHGTVSGGQLTEPVTFDRNTNDPPDARPETALVGKTVEMDVRTDGRVTGFRGVDAESVGQASVAIAVIADLSTLVVALPEGSAAAGATWSTDTLEGRGLLRRQVVARHEMGAISADQASVEVVGKILAAPEGAPDEFADGIRVVEGERRATYRLARSDGLPLVARHETEYTVEARLSASDVDVRVETKTIVGVRRRETAGDAASGRLAPEPGGQTPNARMPAWIGTPRPAIRRQLGEPTESSNEEGVRFDVFAEFGLMYEYDAADTVREISAARWKGGKAFAGRILGIGLGDLLAQAEALWGQPSRAEEPGVPWDRATFAFDDLTLELDVAREAGTTEPFGKHEADQILRIRVHPTN